MKYRIVKDEKRQFENWKCKSKVYLVELQNFLDVASNIKDAELEQRVIIQMLKCDRVLTKLAEQKLLKIYAIGKRESMNKRKRE